MEEEQETKEEYLDELEELDEMDRFDVDFINRQLDSEYYND